MFRHARQRKIKATLPLIVKKPSIIFGTFTHQTFTWPFRQTNSFLPTLQQHRLYLFSFWSKQHNGRQSAVKISHLAGQIWFHQDKDLWHWLLFTDFTLGRLNGSTQRHFLQQHKFISERDLRQAETGGSRLEAPHKQIIWPDFVELFMRAWQTYYCQLLISLQLTGNAMPKEFALKCIHKQIVHTGLCVSTCHLCFQLKYAENKIPGVPTRKQNKNGGF